MATSPQPADPPLSLEPVVGWRTWRLERRGGVLKLASVTRSDVWPPNAVMRTRCSRHSGPTEGCTCGLYAASSPENLARSGMLNAATCVVGAIAMWGTIVEHERGARSQYAYPARLRLVCGACLGAGTGAVDPVVVANAGPMLAVCERHRSDIRGISLMPADQIQSELLATYGVDVMPIERINDSMRTHPEPETPSAADPLRAVAKTTGSIVKRVLSGLFVLWACSGLIFVGLALVVGALQVVARALGLAPDAATSPVAVMSPVVVTALPPVTGDRPTSLDNFTHHRRPRPPAPFAMVCGVGEGDTVRIVACSGDMQQLFGWAELTAPKGAEHDCFGPWDAYSRGSAYWICWTDFRPPLSVHPWASAPNPWSIPVEEGGAIHEHR